MSVVVQFSVFLKVELGSKRVLGHYNLRRGNTDIGLRLIMLQLSSMIITTKCGN